MSLWRPRPWPKAASLLPVFAAVLTGAVMVLAPATTENAVANGDTRTIHLHHAHTHEAIDATYMVDGQYDSVVLEKLNWFLRDWRRDEPTHMDPRLFDTVWEVYRESGSQQPVEVMSAYRSPETNAMLRRASRAVAEHSQHILGKAMDQHYVDVPMSRIREIAMRLQRGGVGFYPTAGTPFVHMDVGGVRHWPRMSYDQLARLFPDGKTVHIPSNGQPLPGYEEARAELEARGDSFNYPTVGEVKSKSGGFFAWLFGGGEEEGDGDAGRGGRQRVATADQAPVGTVSGDAPVGLSGRNDGARTFFAADAARRPAPPSASPAPAAVAGRRQPAGRVQVASLPPAQPDPAQAEAQQALADAMRRQEQAKAVAAAQAAAAAQQAQAADEAQALAEAQAAAQAKAYAQAAAQPEAAPQAPAPEASAPEASASAEAPVNPPPPALHGDRLAAQSVDAPLPPRRPVELASAGPEAPLPPARPTGMTARNDRAPTPGSAGAFDVASIDPARRPALPAAIVQGTGSSPLVPRVLAYAAPPAARPLALVPLPVARPQFVAARLDRSNFPVLTGSTPASRTVPRAGLGSSLTALRPAARASLGALALQATSAQPRGFGSAATDLSSDRFSGTAVKSERINTAILRRPRADTPD